MRLPALALYLESACLSEFISSWKLFWLVGTLCLSREMDGLICEQIAKKNNFRCSISSALPPHGSRMPAGNIQPARLLCCFSGVLPCGREVCSGLGLSLPPYISVPSSGVQLAALLALMWYILQRNFPQ